MFLFVVIFILNRCILSLTIIFNYDIMQSVLIRKNKDEAMKYIKNFWQHRHLLSELVKKGIKLKYRRSYLGIIWSLIEPILTTIVLVVVFGTLMGVKNKTFPLYVLCGRLIYSFFSSGTNGALRSIRANSGMIKKVYVPKYLYPMSSILFNFVIFLISLIILIPLALYCHVTPKLSWLYIFLPLLLLIMLTFGVGMILATIDVFFRDMEYLWNVATLLIMYMSAIFYYPDKLLDSRFYYLIKYNPLYGIIKTFRDCMLGTPLNWEYIGYAAGFSMLCIIIGTFVFYKKQDVFILHI